MVIFAFHETGKTFLSERDNKYVDWENIGFLGSDNLIKKILPDLCISHRYHFLNIKLEFLEFFLKESLPFLIILPKIGDISYLLETSKWRYSKYLLSQWEKKYLEYLDLIKKFKKEDHIYWIDIRNNHFISTDLERIKERFFEINKNNQFFKIILTLHELEIYLAENSFSGEDNKNDFIMYSQKIHELKILVNSVVDHISKKLSDDTDK